QCEIDVTGADHPDAELLGRMGDVERALKVSAWQGAWKLLTSLPKPSMLCPQARRAELDGLWARAWRGLAKQRTAAAQAALATKEEAACEKCLQDIREMSQFRQTSAPEDAAIRQELSAVERQLDQIVRAGKGTRDALARIRGHIDAQRIREAHLELARLAAAHPDMPEVKDLDRALVDSALAAARRKADASSHPEALALIDQLHATGRASAHAKELATLAVQCGKGLRPASGQDAARAFDLALRLDPDLASDESVSWARIDLAGPAVALPHLRDFLTRFPASPNAPKAYLAAARLLSAGLADPRAALAAEDRALLLAACRSVAGSDLPAGTRKTAETLKEVVELDQLVAAARLDRPVLLKAMDGMYRRLLELGAPGAVGGEHVEALIVRPEVIAAALERARRRLEWGVSLAHELDHKEVGMSLKLNAQRISDQASAEAAAARLSDTRLLIFECPTTALTGGQIDQFQKWGMRGGCIWIVGTDLGTKFGFLSLRPINKDGVRVQILACPAEAQRGEQAQLLAGLPAQLGTFTLLGGRYGIDTRKIVGLIPVLECRVSGGRAYAAAAYVYGKGRTIFTTVDLGRQTATTSRLAYNLKCYACPPDSPPAPAGPGRSDLD
ncbi:MAG TPA: hypothetical protein VM695_11410, partial [Phycisphaerae bacterium]|nr:hypothetical protein [Phycisphaerae bacterium]